MNSPSQRALSTDDLEFICETVRRETAIVLGEAKRYMIRSRLERVAREAGFPDVLELVAAVRRAPFGDLKRKLVESLTTNETYFFRDEGAWTYLRTHLIPELVERCKETRSLHIWCGASSTGQEPYSLALLLREHFPELSSWKVEILATDVDQSVLDRATEGIYDQFEVNRGLPAPLLVKHFERRGRRWHLRPEIRSTVRFRRLNLAGPWTGLPRKLNLVLLRNVLIYFDPAVRRSILERLSGLIDRDGYLLFGTSELAHPVHGLFVVADRGSGAYRPLEKKSSIHR